ncbi:MAG: WG repeat-containing protein [Bacteroidota bacterium]
MRRSLLPAGLLAVLLTLSACDAVGLGGDGGSVVRQDVAAFPVQIDSLWGFIDVEGRLTVPPTFDFADEVYGDLSAVRVGTLWGYARPDGSIAVEPQFQVAGRFTGRLAPVRTTTDGWAFVDPTGATVGASGYDSAEPFSDGRAAVRSGILWGYVDENGTAVIEPQFAAAGPFVNGLAPVQTADGWQYIRQNGEIAFGGTFDEARPFSDVGLAPIREAGAEVWKYVDASGQIALNTTYETAAPFTEGYAAVRVGSRTAFIDREGAFLVGPELAEAGAFSEGLAAVRFNSRWTYIGREDGLIVTSPSFSAARPFRGGLAQVTLGSDDDARVGYVDMTGDYVWEPTN